MAKRVTKKADRVPMPVDEIAAAKGEFKDLNPDEEKRKQGVLGSHIRGENAKKVISGDMRVVDKKGEKRESEYLQSVGSFNANIRRTHIPEEIRNSYENYQFIKRQFTGRKKRARDLDAQRGSGRGPILVIGSGPSFESMLPILHKWKGAVICTSSHATTCVHAGKDPTYIAQLDHRSVPSKLNCNWWRGRDTSLIIHPTVNHAFMKNWKGRTYFYRKIMPDVALHGEIIPQAYGQWITMKMAVFSSSVPAQIGLADTMGYSPIILVGCDFGVDRFRKWSYEKREKWLPRTWPFGHWVRQAPPAREVNHLMTAENGVLSTNVQIYYKRSLICGWRLDKSQVIHAVWGLNRGAKKTSVLEEFPQGDAEEIVETQGANLQDLYLSIDEIKDVADKFLIRQRTYPIPIGPEEEGAGLFFQEFNNWHQGLPEMAMSLNAQGAKVDLVGLTARFERLEAENKREHPREGGDV